MQSREAEQQPREFQKIIGLDVTVFQLARLFESRLTLIPVKS